MTKKTAEQVPTTEVPMQLLANIASLIDAVVERGAIKGNELTGVAQLREAVIAPVTEYMKAQEARQSGDTQG